LIRAAVDVRCGEQASDFLVPVDLFFQSLPDGVFHFRSMTPAAFRGSAILGVAPVDDKQVADKRAA
jgi:hypothetical protein